MSPRVWCFLQVSTWDGSAPWRGDLLQKRTIWQRLIVRAVPDCVLPSTPSHCSVATLEYPGRHVFGTASTRGCLPGACSSLTALNTFCGLSCALLSGVCRSAGPVPGIVSGRVQSKAGWRSHNACLSHPEVPVQNVSMIRLCSSAACCIVPPASPTPNRYNDLKNIDKLERVKAQVQDVALLMHSSLEGVADLSDKMDSVVERSGKCVEGLGDA